MIQPTSPTTNSARMRLRRRIVPEMPHTSAAAIRLTSSSATTRTLLFFFFFKQKTAYEIGLGIPAEPLFRSQPQSHLSFCVLLQYLVERRRVVTQLGKLD